MSEPKPVYHVIEWQGCYDDSWQHVITPDSFQHPAKFSRGLIHRIYAHMLERGYIAPGDSVVDPFGGIAAGAYDALLFGLHWTGCELEPRFVELGRRNIEKWRHDLRMLNGRLGSARLLQGDSRRLAEVVGAGMGAVVSSPPFGEGETRNRSEYQPGFVADMMSRAYTQDKQGTTDGNLATLRADDAGFSAAVSSPPYVESLSSPKDTENIDKKITAAKATGRTAQRATWGRNQGSAGWSADAYGSAAGQLGSMPPGSFDSAVSSPPYADAVNGQGEGPGARHDPIYHNGDNAYKASSANGYGETPGNLGSMAGEGFEAAVSSPPFGGEGQHTGGPMPLKHNDGRKAPRVASGMVHGDAPYGDTPGQLATLRVDDTFWSAARVIVEQTYQVLKPGGYAAWVTKRFVRNKQIVEFSDQWEALCAAVGFERVERIHALLVEDHGEQLDIFGGAVAKRTERKSFFRRLAEKKGSPRIDHEDVIIMRKPL